MILGAWVQIVAFAVVIETLLRLGIGQITKADLATMMSSHGIIGDKPTVCVLQAAIPTGILRGRTLSRCGFAIRLGL